MPQHWTMTHEYPMPPFVVGIWVVTLPLQELDAQTIMPTWNQAVHCAVALLYSPKNRNGHIHQAFLMSSLSSGFRILQLGNPCGVTLGLELYARFFVSLPHSARNPD